MQLLLALVLFGAVCGVVVRNRTGAAGGALLGALVAWYVGPRVGGFVGLTPSGRRIAETLEHAGAGHVSIWMMVAAAFVGVLIAWGLFGRSKEHRPDWEWDPDHPKYRRRLRRRMAG
ncbi:MAG TPA: hypothetical protein VEA15_09750 [Caulobacteraceae bacterium]|nr:hypothetical protein [Caulobacteraceae bacterium]